MTSSENGRLPIRRARDQLPPNACDTHIHILGDPDRYPYIPNRSYTPEIVLESQYQAIMESTGIARLVIIQPSIFGTDNRCMLDAITVFGLDRCRGIAVVDEHITEAELLTLHANGVRGVRFNLIHGKTDMSLRTMERLAERIVPLGWHIELYGNGDLLPERLKFLMSLPTPIVIDHMGQIMTEGGIERPSVHALRRLIDSGKGWVKLSGLRCSSAGPPYQDLTPLARALVGASGERCLWGSDWPHGNFAWPMPDFTDLIGLLSDWVPSRSIRHRILVENAAEIYGFNEPGQTP